MRLRYTYMRFPWEINGQLHFLSLTSWSSHAHMGIQPARESSDAFQNTLLVLRV